MEFEKMKLTLKTREGIVALIVDKGSFEVLEEGQEFHPFDLSRAEVIGYRVDVDPHMYYSWPD